MIILHEENNGYYDYTIYPEDHWTLNEYQEFFSYLYAGYLIHSLEDSGFILDHEYIRLEGDPIFSLNL